MSFFFCCGLGFLVVFFFFLSFLWVLCWLFGVVCFGFIFFVSLCGLERN